MIKGKVHDFFFAGVVFGISDGLIYNVYIVILKLLRINTQTPWEDATALFFSPPEIHMPGAQIFGFLMSLNGPLFISIALCLLVQLTSKAFTYIKSIALAELTTFFSFAIVYPALGYGKHSLVTIYYALVGMLLFGLVLGYFVKKYTDFENR